MDKVRNHISPFAMLQTFCHTLFSLRQTSQCNLLKTSLIFLHSKKNILYKFQANFMARFSSKQFNTNSNFEKLQWRHMVSPFSH